MLSNIKSNCVGTTNFDAKFPGMRKAQEFVVYPIGAGHDGSKILVQSDTRIGYIYMSDGLVKLAGPFPGGAYNHHLAIRKEICRLSGEDLMRLKTQIMSTASPRAGTNGLVVDNSNAIAVVS